ncbi:MAG: GNAT family N-acetyltransferase, partial [Burkholderiales bacterium]|nr:GNAT family N-acetyltransferase [Burkholderiales bacterium]
FDDADRYLGKPPDDAYLADLLADRTFVAIAGLADGVVVGGLAGYVLRKFERATSEVYLYDLAVLETHRRRGVATRMIEALQRFAAAHGAEVIFVQADYGDDAAIALYTRLGTREDVMHFDIPPAADGA